MNKVDFRIFYKNPKKPVPQPELFEGYNLESALDDYLPCGAEARISIGSYVLEMTGIKFLDLVHSCLPLAEQLFKLSDNESNEIRESIPGLSPEVKIYYWLFGDFILWLPIIVFATDGMTVKIYTRTISEADGRSLIILPERDFSGPVAASHSAVAEEILTFLTHFLNDLVDAFPFLARDDKYQTYRNKINTLSPQDGLC